MSAHQPIPTDLTSAQAEAIAVWHMEHAEWEWGNRHDMIAFRLFKLARDLRRSGL